MIKNFLSPQIKENIWRVVLEYKEKRENISTFLERNLLREELYQIKKQVIDNLEEIKKQAIVNLEKNNIKVFEAKDAAEARDLIEALTRNDRVILKSKSNIADEIDLKSIFVGKELVETDLGDMINQWMTEEDLHPVFPAFHLTPEKIIEKIYQKFGQKIESRAEAIAAFARQYLRKKIPEATVGITGANVITADGRIILLENEGNISLVSRWPDRHIVISGVEKLAQDLESAMKIIKASAIWGAGQDWPVYVSIISGPSKTADIQNKLVIGAQGAKEVYLILIDNGRSRLLKEGLEELLFCLNCGACLNFCPVFHQLGREYGDRYLGSKGIIFTALSRGLLQAKKSNAYACTLCSACFENCPVKINLPELMKKIRNRLNGAALSTEENKKMIANLQKFGNPFGEIFRNELPDKLYCC